MTSALRAPVVQSKGHLKVIALPKSSLSLIPSQPVLQAVSAKDCHSAYSHCRRRLPVLPPLPVKLASRPPDSERAGTSVCLCTRPPPPTADAFHSLSLPHLGARTAQEHATAWLAFCPPFIFCVVCRSTQRIQCKAVLLPAPLTSH